MVRRLQPTLMDYVVIAINPALIMVLIGSLVYFLLEMFYQGQYPERLHYCLTLFIFAAVLIARISMEEGWDRAAPFGAFLAIAICLAMHRFVSYEGRSYEALGWLINYALIGLTWWCAIQLTWDCTLIDETQDASGEGLLSTAGLDREDPRSDDDQATHEVAKPLPSVAPPRKEKNVDPNNSDRDFEDDMAWSTQKQSAKKPGQQPEKKQVDGEKSWWDKFLERRRRPHAPGVWVVYFSLAALPIFGFGQAFIPVGNTGSRRYAFVLLCVYVATALGLLLTTSFLGLRRYLRQRRLEMPLAMAGTWLVTGAVLIVALLVLTMLLPRPNAEYAISQLPLAAGSAEHDSSQLAMAKEGTRDEQAKTAPGTRSRPEKERSTDEHNQNGAGEDRSGNDKSGAATRDHTSDGQANSDRSKSGNGKGAGSKADQSKSESKNDGSQTDQSKGDRSKSDEQSSGSAREQSSGEKSGGDKSNGSQPAESQNQKQGQPEQSKSESSQSKSGSGQSQAEPSQPTNTLKPPDLSAISDSLAALFKWIFYGAIVVIALWWSWNHREQLLAWLQALLTGWRDLWGLLGRKSPMQEIVPPAPRHKSFYDYADPFASGAAGQYSPAELVRYSFEAFEAWARDHGWPREADQTAYEFVRQVGGHATEVAKPARTLADLYSRAAYAPGTLPASSVEHLRALWDTLREKQPVGF
jgi:hypothetical protein